MQSDFYDCILISSFTPKERRGEERSGRRRSKDQRLNATAPLVIRYQIAGMSVCAEVIAPWTAIEAEVAADLVLCSNNLSREPMEIGQVHLLLLRQCVGSVLLAGNEPCKCTRCTQLLAISCPLFLLPSLCRHTSLWIIRWAKTY